MPVIFKRFLTPRQGIVLLLAGTATPIAYAFSTLGGAALEPGNLALLGCGLVALGTIRRLARNAA